MNRRHGTHVILGAITPAYDSVDAETLTYPNLRSALKHQSFPAFVKRNSKELWRKRLNISPASIQEDWHAAYLLNAAYRLQRARTLPQKVFWSTQFTTTSVKLFGRPLSREVASLAASELEYFESAVAEFGIDEEFATPVLDGYRSLLSRRAKPLPALEERYGDLLSRVHDYFMHEYGDCFKVLEPYAVNVPLKPLDIADCFEAALDVLKSRDSAWESWSVVMDRSAKLSVNVHHKRIVVGRRRAPMLVGELRGLLAHEVLVHAMRAVRGANRCEDLMVGLPDYLAAEEGMGVLVESAICGSVPAKVKDRYVDIALALGAWNRRPLLREEMYTFCFSRAVMRSVAADELVDLNKLEKTIWEHVNRIYRGSLGNNYVAVFTKDVAYYRGFVKMANYLKSSAKRGRLADSLAYLYKGKFDPTNAAHRKVVQAFDD